MPQPTQAAIDLLRRQPESASQFEEVFGKGSSTQYLSAAQPGILNTIGNVASDIGTGIAEAPRAIVRGAENAINETSSTAKAAGDYLNQHVLDLGQIKVGPGGVHWEHGTPQGNSLQVPQAITPDEPTSTTGHLIEGVSQFTTGMVGAGKFLKAFGIGATAGEGALSKFALTSGRAAIADATVFDPHADRLSNLIQSYPALQNPVTDFLASKATDSATVGRLKNAVEGFLTGTALEGFVHGVKAIKLARQGDLHGAADAAEEVAKVHDADAPVAPEGQPKPADAPASPASVAPEPAVSVNTRTAEEVPNADAPAEGQSKPVETEAPLPATGVEPFKLSDEELQTYRDNLNARFTVGGQEMALTGADFNFSKWNTQDDIKAAANAMANVVQGRLNDIRGGDENGVRSWDQVNANAAAIAQVTGSDPNLMVQRLVTLAGNVKNLDAETKAYGDMLVSLSDHSNKLSQMLTDGTHGDYGSMDGLKAAYAHSTQLLGNTYALLKGVQTNIARAQNSAKMARAVNPDIMRSLEGLNPEDGEALMTLAKRQAATSRGVNDPLAAASATRQLLEGSWLDKSIAVHNEFWFNSVLSGVKTHAVNVTANAVRAIFMPAEQMVAGLLSRNTPQYLEGTYQYAGMRKALADSFAMAQKAFQVQDNVLDYRGAYEGVHKQVINAAMFGQQDNQSLAPLINGIGTVVRIPSRMLMAEDEFFKQITYRSRVYASAMREGVQQGLDPEKTAALVEQRMSEAFDPAGHASLTDASGVPVAARVAALKQAREATFTQPLDYGVGRWLEQGAQAHPGIKLLMPFIRVPTNIIRDVWQHTPALGLVQKQMKEDFAAGGERASLAWAKQATGAALWATAVGAAYEGKITGYGPVDPQLRKTWLMQNQPYSFVSTDPDTGKKTFTSFSRLDPYGIPFGMAADFAAIAGQLGDEDVDTFAKGAVLAMVNNLASKTYLQGLIQAVNVISDNPKQKLDAWMEHRAASYIPNILGTASPDPYLREVRGVLDAMVAKVPGFSSTLPPRRDVLGAPILVPIGSPWNPISPFAVKTVEPDEVRNEMARLAESSAGIRFPMPSTKADGVDLTKVRGEDGQSFYDKWMQAIGQTTIGGLTLHDKLAATMANSGYRDAADGDAIFKRSRKVDMIDADLDRYRHHAYRETLKEFPELQGALKGYRQGARRVRAGQTPPSDPFAVFN